MRLSALAAALAVTFPTASWAVQALEDFRFPDSGAYPAYPAANNETGRYVHAYVYGGLYRDSNLFRLPSSANPQSENWRRLGAGLRAEVPVSRQRFTVEAQVDDNRFDKNNFLDFTGSRARGVWNWEVGNLFQGDLGASREKGMSGFGQLQSVTSSVMVQDRVFGSANFRVTPDWRLRAAADRQAFKADSPALAIFNNEQNNATLGVDYVTGLQNSVGAQVRYARGQFPNQQVTTPTGITTINSHYKEVEPALVAHYNLGGKSSLDGRIGYTKRTHEQLPTRDYKGSTGNLVFHWTPTPKTLLDATLYRETRPYVTNSAGGFLTSIDATASYALSRGIRLEPHWAITDQIVLQAALVDERDTFKGDPSIVILGTPEREDKFRTAMIGVGWSPLRPVLLSLSFEHGNRTSNIANRDFKYDAVSLNARYTFF